MAIGEENVMQCAKSSEIAGYVELSFRNDGSDHVFKKKNHIKSRKVNYCKAPIARDKYPINK